MDVDSADKFEFTRCPLCDFNNHSLVFEGIDRKLCVSKEKFRVVKCQSCGLIFNNPRLKEEFLSEYYPRSYPPYQSFKAELKPNLLRKILYRFSNSEFYRMSRCIDRLTKGHKGKLLDVGCGNGKLLYVMKKLGWDVYGVEPDKNCCEYVTKTLGIEVSNGTLMDTKFSNNFFDVVVFRHSFEHLMNPNDILEEVHRVLQKEGTLVIILPDAGSIEARLFREKWSGFDLPRHICHYTQKTIGAILAKNGFKHITIRAIPDAPSLRASVQYLLFGRLILGANIRKVTYPYFLIISWIVYPFKGSGVMEVRAKKATFSK